MKKQIFSFVLAVTCFVSLNALSVSSKGTKKVPVMVMGIGSDKSELEKLCQTIKTDLGFTGQFAVDVEFSQEVPTTKKIKGINKTHPLLVAVTSDGKKEKMEWRLYDTNSSTMKRGKSVKKRGNLMRDWGHSLSDGILNALTDAPGFFGSKIAFCRQTKKNTTDIYMMDYDGSSVKKLLSLDSLAIAPRWNNDISQPLILYSQYTPTNVRLMYTSLEGKTGIAADFDGLNMLPAFSADGTDVILCLSVEGSSQLYRYVHYAKKHKGKYIPLTNNKGNNISPTVMPNGDIIFCSDFESKKPQIYKMDSKGRNWNRLTEGGFCTSPSYCAANNKLAFIKNISGRGQIMVYDMETEKLVQLTSDASHKEECCWSPCGNYMLFGTDDGKKKRLAHISLLTKRRTYITDGTFNDGYPSWSHYPIIQ